MPTDWPGPPRSTIATWTYLSQHATAGRAAAPATPRGFAAWRYRDHALARHACACACACADDPACVMAAVLDQALTD